jgi:ferredoxin-NADP reductase
MAATSENLLTLCVRAIEDLAQNIKAFELVSLDGEQLPPFTPGAHIEVVLPQGRRHYSICSNPRDRFRYLIAVLRKEQGSGGSKFMHDQLGTGDRIQASLPRNNFELIDDATKVILVAGGIGITPFLPMVEELRGRDTGFELHYCARSGNEAAFVRALSSACSQGELSLHYDGGDPRIGLNVDQLLKEYRHGTHVYCCGPSGLMQAVRAATSAWPEGAIHFEYFAPNLLKSSAEAETFKIVVGSLDLTLEVPADRSIARVLRDNGIDVDTSCEAGTCGTCRTRYLSGQPIHNDFVLTAKEQLEYVMICCARARGAPLVLDL